MSNENLEPSGIMKVISRSLLVLLRDGTWEGTPLVLSLVVALQHIREVGWAGL